MKNCNTCIFNNNLKCEKHSSYHGDDKIRLYETNDSKIDFFGHEEIMITNDFGCSQHKSNRTLITLTNEEFLTIIDKKLILEDYQFNKQNYSEDEWISIQKSEFINKLENGYSSSERFTFKEAISISKKLWEIGINLG